MTDREAQFRKWLGSKTLPLLDRNLLCCSPGVRPADTGMMGTHPQRFERQFKVLNTCHHCRSCHHHHHHRHLRRQPRWCACGCGGSPDPTPQHRPLQGPAHPCRRRCCRHPSRRHLRVLHLRPHQNLLLRIFMTQAGNCRACARAKLCASSTALTHASNLQLTSEPSEVEKLDLRNSTTSWHN